MTYRRSLCLLALAALLGSSCEKHVLPTQATAEVSAVERVAQESMSHRRNGAASVTGTTESGSLFALYRPANWSGDLAVYAHGFTPPTDPIHLPPIEELRDELLARPNDGSSHR